MSLNVSCISQCHAFTQVVIHSMNIIQVDEEFEERIGPCHQRAAERILKGCLKNSGLYIKLGQGLTTFNHILPPQYLKTLERLQDKALFRKPHEVRLHGFAQTFIMPLENACFSN